MYLVHSNNTFPCKSRHIGTIITKYQVPYHVYQVHFLSTSWGKKIIALVLFWDINLKTTFCAKDWIMCQWWHCGWIGNHHGDKTGQKCLGTSPHRPSPSREMFPKKNSPVSPDGPISQNVSIGPAFGWNQENSLHKHYHCSLFLHPCYCFVPI